MKFRVEEINSKPVAVFADETPLRTLLLTQFLLPSDSFVIDILCDILRVEKGFYESYAFENPEVYIELFKDRVTIEPYLAEEETEVQGIEIEIDEAKLLLFEWGAALKKWQLARKGL